jgi:hypothetical protein
LGSRHAAAEAAFVDAKAKLQRHLLEADLDADEKVGVKLEAPSPPARRSATISLMPSARRAR